MALKPLIAGMSQASASGGGGGIATTAYVINTQSGDYTLILSDAQKLIQVVNSSVTTIPLNSNVAFPLGTWIDIQCSTPAYDSNCQVTAEFGVTLNVSGGIAAGASYVYGSAYTRIIKTETNTWYAMTIPFVQRTTKFLVGDGEGGMSGTELTTVPNTAALQKGSGGGGVLYDAIPGTDYVVPLGVTVDLIQTNGSITPIADGTYTVGIGLTQNGTITTKKGFITAIQEAT